MTMITKSNPRSTDRFTAYVVQGVVQINGGTGGGGGGTPGTTGMTPEDWNKVNEAINKKNVRKFTIDTTKVINKNNLYLYEIPKETSIDENKDFVELSLNGNELISQQYDIVVENSKVYIAITEKLLDSDYMYGEIYKNGIT